jgi:hypothetical protein
VTRMLLSTLGRLVHPLQASSGPPEGGFKSLDGTHVVRNGVHKCQFKPSTRILQSALRQPTIDALTIHRLSKLVPLMASAPDRAGQ